ncbi:hypothetical protein P9112_011517 [Eukaryota sp. TZLM1-RC]
MTRPWTLLVLSLFFSLSFALVCDNAVDIVLVVDSSLSVEDSWDQIQDFLSDSVDFLSVSDNGIHLSIHQFSLGAQREVCLTGTRCVLRNTISNMLPLLAVTEIKEGLLSARDELLENSRFKFGESNDQVVILVTDGQDDINEFYDIVTELHDNNVNVYTIGVGQQQHQENLKFIADTDDHYLSVSDYSELSRVLPQIADEYCDYFPTPTSLCGRIVWLVGLALTFQSVLLYFNYYLLPSKNRILQNLQLSALVCGVLLVLFLILSSFIYVTTICVFQAILSISIIAISAYIGYISILPLIRRQYNSNGSSRAAESVMGFGGSTPASMSAFRLSDQKVTKSTTVPSQSTVSQFQTTENPLSGAARSLSRV